MKQFYVLLLSILLVGCYSYREYPVEYDYSYNGRFKNYKTFAFLNNGSSEETSTNVAIEKAIQNRMQLQGYRFRNDKPNLLVTYMIYFDSLNFRGYDQPDIEKWIKYQNEDEDYDAKNYDLRKGTLLIQFYDRKQNRTIWQGYATGVYGNIYFNNERQLRVAVRSILDRYQFLAEDFLKDKEFVIQEDVNDVE